MAVENDKVVYKAFPLGFCAGVKWAIDNATDALKQDERIKIYGNLVNNHLVVGRLAALGAQPVIDLQDIHQGDSVMITAHGLSKTERMKLLLRKPGRLIDSTCPLVEVVYDRVHRALEIARKADKEAEILYICKDTEHVEPRNVIAEAPDNIRPIITEEDIHGLEIDPNKMYFVDTQTTLNIEKAMQWIDLLKLKIPELTVPASGDVCYATKNRQSALRRVLELKPELLLVFGSVGISSNTRELTKIAASYEVPVQTLEAAEFLEESMTRKLRKIAVTAGASAPPEEPDMALDRLQQWGFTTEIVKVADEPSFFKRKPKIENFNTREVA